MKYADDSSDLESAASDVVGFSSEQFHDTVLPNGYTAATTMTGEAGVQAAELGGHLLVATNVAAVEEPGLKSNYDIADEITPVLAHKEVSLDGDAAATTTTGELSVQITSIASAAEQHDLTFDPEDYADSAIELFGAVALAAGDPTAMAMAGTANDKVTLLAPYPTAARWKRIKDYHRVASSTTRRCRTEMRSPLQC